MTIEEIAIKKAAQSNCRYRISAIGISKEGKIVGSSTNRQRFCKLHGGLHAERLLIAKYSKQLKTIIICRIGNSGNILPIKPCIKCQELANKFGIKIISIEK